MKQISRSFMIILALSAILLSACGAVAATEAASGGKVLAAPLAFTGVVESITGNQWVINGQAITVDPAVLRDGPFAIGDTVKVEGTVNSDGSFTVSRVEAPSETDLSQLPQFGNDNSNDANSNDGNSNDVNNNDANSNDSNINDDNSNDSNSNADDSIDDNSNDTNGNSNDSIGSNSNSDDSGSGGSGGGSGGGDDSGGGSGGGDDSGGGGGGSGGGGGG